MPHPESDAIQKIEEALAPLDNPARLRVIAWAYSRFDLTPIVPGSLSPQGGHQTPPGQPPLPPPSQPPPAGTIKDFVTGKKPQNTYERIACLVYYLEKVQNVNSVKTKEITQANTDARLSKMTNPSIFVAEATRQKGYLSALGGGKKVLSARGEALVDALPDREAVQKALDDHPFKGKPSGGKKAPKP